MKLNSNLKRSLRYLAVLIMLAIIIPLSSAQLNNTVSIGDAVLDAGSNVTLPVTVINATGIGSVGINLSYSASVVNATNATRGDFTSYFAFDNSNASKGWVTINTFIVGTQFTSNATIANVTLEARADSGESQLNIEILAMSDQNGTDIQRNVDNGTFNIRAQTSTSSSGSGGGGGGAGGASGVFSPFAISGKKADVQDLSLVYSTEASPKFPEQQEETNMSAKTTVDEPVVSGLTIFLLIGSLVGISLNATLVFKLRKIMTK